MPSKDELKQAVCAAIDARRDDIVRYSTIRSAGANA